MVEVETSAEDVESLADESATDPRQRSTIGFPYADLSDVEALAFSIYNNVAFGSCSDDQLAPWLGMSAKSSGFRIRVSAARMFGVIDTDGGQHSLAPLGKMLVDPMRQRVARVDAFLAVPLFGKVFDDYKGTALPPAAALERAIEGMGVAPKQKSRARQILERSAEQAGFFEHGKGRLVRPGVAGAAKTNPVDPPAGTQNEGGGGGGGGGNGGGTTPPLDDLVKALVARIPHGTKWDADARSDWFRAAHVIFDLVYGSGTPDGSK